MPTMSSLNISIKHYAYVMAAPGNTYAFNAYACIAREDWGLGIQEHLNLYSYKHFHS